jgi:superfamily II DNA or RNA helicase
MQQFRPGMVVRIRGQRWRIDRHVGLGDSAIVDVTGCGPANRGEPAQFLLPFELVDRLPTVPAPRLVSRARWRRVARHALAHATPSWASLRAAASANLTIMPFQLEPAMALVRGDGCRFLIADAVGLGKTVEAGLMLAETVLRRPDARLIVVCPAGLRSQWREELHRRFSLDAEVMDAEGVARIAAHLPGTVNPWAVRPLAIASIDYIKRPEVMRSLEGLVWDVAVLDEAHHLIGRSDRAEAAAALGDRARALVMLTATPHSGDDAAFARLCTLGGAGGSAPLLAFRRTRADVGLHGQRRAPLLRVRPTAAEAAMHDALIAYARLVWNHAAEGSLSGARLAASVLTRRGCSSAGSLARSVERRLAMLAGESIPHQSQGDLPFAGAIDDDEEPHALLQPVGLPRDYDERHQLERLLQLARTAMTGESKMTSLQRFLSRIDEPAIVFTEYRDTLQRLAGALSPLNAIQLHGGLSLRERADVTRQFTHGSARLLLATDAGSEGLNLHDRCRLVINLELPWTPLRLEQRAGRVDRIGQQRRVHAIHLVAAGTCEETTLARLASRIKRMHGAMSLLARLPDAARVAESILGQRADPDVPDNHAATPSAFRVSGSTPAIVALNLGRDAQDEANRIGRAHALSPGSPPAIVSERPAITRIAARRRATPPHCLWVFRTAFTTRDGCLVWEALVPVEGGVVVMPRRSAASIRVILNPDQPHLQQVLRQGCELHLRKLQHSLDEALNRWTERERNIVATLRARHARMSAAMVQRGLFDHRVERRAAAQGSLLDHALARSASRLNALAQWRDLRLDTSELVCAVLFE